jgi:rRNA maturation endonuclease Nob1
MSKGPSYFDMMDAIKFHTKYQYFCAICDRGPFFTGATRTDCPSCGAEITLTQTPDGDIITTGKKPKRS